MRNVDSGHKLLPIEIARLFSNLTAIQLRFRLRFINGVDPGLFWSQTVRGGIGYQMKEKVCKNSPACAKACESTPPCFFGRLYNEFDNSAKHRDIKTVIFREPIVDTRRKLADVPIILINPESELVDEIIRDMYYLTEKGMHRGNKFKIEDVRYLDLSGSYSLGKYGPMNLWDSFQHKYRPGNAELTFHTPLCIEHRGEPCFEPTPAQLLNAALRRIRLLHEKLFDEAPKVNHEDIPELFIPKRYGFDALEVNQREKISGKKNHRITLWGVTGKMFIDDASPVANLLLAAAGGLHIGRHVTLGLGEVSLRIT